jgi:hypothetical protein
MRFAFVAVVFATAVAANPFAWAAPQASVLPSAGKPNRTHRGNRTSHHHHEPTPVFKQPCDCPKPIVPINLLTANEVSAWRYLGRIPLTKTAEMFDGACSCFGVLHRVEGWMSITCASLWTHRSRYRPLYIVKSKARCQKHNFYCNIMVVKDINPPLSACSQFRSRYILEQS